MGHVPDHTPAAAATEHAALIAALDAGDLAGLELRRAADLAVACEGCVSLLADLAVLRAATAALPPAHRTRDYRLTDADADRLRPSVWGRLVEWLAAPRSTVRPLAGGLAALGVAGLLLSTTPGISGQAATMLSTTGAPVAAPVAPPNAAGAASNAAGAVEGNPRLGAAPSATDGPGSAVTAQPATVPALGAPGATPGAAALPVPSPASAALPASTAAPSAGVLAGPAQAATPGPSGFAAGAMDTAPKEASPEALEGERNAALSPPSAPAPPDRALPLLLSLVMLAAGIGLFLTNRVLRRRAEA